MDRVGLFGFLGIRRGADLFKDFEGGGGFLDGFRGIGDDEGKLRNGFDAMTARGNKGGDSGGSKSGGDGEAALGDVDAAVPAAPDLGWSEHSTSTAHVAERTLASAVGAATRSAGNTGDCAAGTPGLGGGLVSSTLGDGVWLAVVGGEACVNEADNVGADRSLKHIREGDGGAGIGGHVAL